jgi:hypothetical protein
MKIFRLFLFAIPLCTPLAGPEVNAGDLFLQMRVERSRCHIPNYDYRANRNPAVSAVVSEPAILYLTPITVASALPGAPTTQLAEQGRAFVFNDLVAGPLVLTSLGAKTDASGKIIVTGVLNHTGGDSGQLLGGKAVIRVEPLTAAGLTAQNSTVIAAKECSCWVRKNEPETVQICVQYSPYHPGAFGDVERVRVFLEYHPNR